MTSETIAQQLKSDFTHRVSDGCSCAICGTDSRPLAFHVLQRSYSKDASIPKSFLVMAMSVDARRGVFPVCDHCAPLCPTCGLPLATDQVLKFRKSVGAQFGEGVCMCTQQANLGERLKTFLQRTLKIGRFKKP